MSNMSRIALLVASAILANALAAGGAVAGSLDGTSAGQALKSAFGGPALDAVGRFDYRLTVEDAAGTVQRDADHVLLPASKRLYLHDRLALAPRDVWSGPDDTWRRTGGQLEYLGPTAADTYRGMTDYHFLPMLVDPQTAYQQLSPDRLRITPAGAAPFEVRLDPATGLIQSNHFDNGVLAKETDYRQVGGIWWPMEFEVVRDGQISRRGRFSATAVAETTALPALTIPDAPLRLPDAQDGVARLVGAGWMSSNRNEYNLSLDRAGRLLAFARSEPEFKSSRIHLSHYRHGAWEKPVAAPFSDPRYSDSDPWLTPDGAMLYFISNRPIGGDGEARKHTDIWRVSLGQTGFGIPEHLPIVSSDGQELGPELHDGWLYFNSTRSDGPAKLSIYRARLGDTGFEQPQALASPFNDGALQGDFTLSPDGQLALFWSQRDGIQELDLFAARREGAGWSQAIRLPSPINAKGLDFTPAFSGDGQRLYFASMRKPAWLDQTGHLLNGQANVYVVPASMVVQALTAGTHTTSSTVR